MAKKTAAKLARDLKRNVGFHFLAVVALLAIFLAGCSKQKKSAQSEEQQISETNVTLIAAQNGNAEAQNTIGNYYSVENISASQEANLSLFDFTLEDSQGNSYSCEQTDDYIHGKIQQGKTGRGGIAFAVSYGGIPKKLIYDTELVNYFNEKIFASTYSLDKLKIFSEPIGERQ